MADSSAFETDKFKDYKSDGCDVINFRLIRDQSELGSDLGIFNPEMTHQIFGETEMVFGYKGLSVDLYYTAGALNTYLKVNYEQKIDPAAADGLEADKVEELVARHMPRGYCSNIDVFSEWVHQDNQTFRPHGTLLHSYTRCVHGKERRFGIYKASIDERGFREYHERLQVFLLYFVDAASFIDVDDDRWDFYLIYEESSDGGDKRFATVGYMTAYRYYAYPDLVRPRISQVLILPPFQRQGHCVELLQTFYRQCASDSGIKDITVEDPSDSFQRVRDYTDCMNCRGLAAFSKLNAFSYDMEYQARHKLKLNQKQARRVYEILRLCSVHADVDHPGYKSELCRRLAAPFKKRASRQLGNFSSVLSPEEMSALDLLESEQQRNELIEKLYRELMEQYIPVVNRLTDN